MVLTPVKMQINGSDDLYSIIAQFLANRATQIASALPGTTTLPVIPLAPAFSLS
jgi:hypothetical protein